MPLASGRKRLAVTLGEGEHRELLALAEEAGVSASWVGRQAIREFLRRWRTGAVQLPLPLPREPRGGREEQP
jgi:hypothetical protein